MRLEDFKAGVWKQQYEYRSFSPAPVNHPWSWSDPAINTLLEQATQALAEVNAFICRTPANPGERKKEQAKPAGPPWQPLGRTCTISIDCVLPVVKRRLTNTMNAC